MSSFATEAVDLELDLAQSDTTPLKPSGLQANVFGAGPSAVFVHGGFGWRLDTFPEQRA